MRIATTKESALDSSIGIFFFVGVGVATYFLGLPIGLVILVVGAALTFAIKSFNSDF